MKIALCHLSDIHFQSNDALNSINRKKQKIINCIKSLLEKEMHVFFIISGDISQSAGKEEYLNALSFISDVGQILIYL